MLALLITAEPRCSLELAASNSVSRKGGAHTCIDLPLLDHKRLEGKDGL
jgi:hypothetical protein